MHTDTANATAKIRRNNGTASTSNIALAVPRFDIRGVEGYTLGMKTAISIKSDVFQKAERLARRMKKSRSRLFSDAVAEYVARHAPDEVTEAMNAAVREAGAEVDEFAAAAARATLERSEW